MERAAAAECGQHHWSGRRRASHWASSRAFGAHLTLVNEPPSARPAQIPYFNGPIFLENKTQVGKVEEIFGPINESYFTIKMMDGVVATSYKPGAPAHAPFSPHTPYASAGRPVPGIKPLARARRAP